MAIAAGCRRRTPGLRREEIAERAGIGVDWYVRLEQGRSASPSLTTVDALARALCLSEAEHAHLRALARGSRRSAFVREEVPPALQRLVSSLSHPAHITGRRWDLLAWNSAAADLFDFGPLPDEERNILLFVLTNPHAQALFGSTWANEAQRMLAQFRATHDLWAADPAFIGLLQRLQRGCLQFTAWWGAHDGSPDRLGRESVAPPTAGAAAL